MVRKKITKGLGIVTKACRLLIENAFIQLQLNKVEVNVVTKNFKSHANPERLGFTIEGTIRNYEYLKGKYLDREKFWTSKGSMGKNGL